MESKKYEEELKIYASKSLPKNVGKETLSKNEHKLLVEGYGCEQLLGIYDDLKDLEIADFSDLFAVERRNGRT